jgi:hypothetical protein
MNAGQQRQRHGVTKNLVEGVGGFVVGAALVLLLRGLHKQRAGSKPEPADVAAAQPEEEKS